jgi:hypothetical protein
MRPWLAAVLVSSASCGGCERSLVEVVVHPAPDEVVKLEVSAALAHDAEVASALCGVPLEGLEVTRISTTTSVMGQTAHVVGVSDGGVPCEGDVQVEFTREAGDASSALATWLIKKLVLTAVQTPGVSFAPRTSSHHHHHHHH